jgi:hypothetical protein
MATKLTKEVRRSATGLGVNRRPFVVTLAPGDVIGFRDAKTRRTYWTTLQHCYALAVRQTVAWEKAQKAKAKKGAK